MNDQPIKRRTLTECHATIHTLSATIQEQQDIIRTLSHDYERLQGDASAAYLKGCADGEAAARKELAQKLAREAGPVMPDRKTLRPYFCTATCLVKWIEEYGPVWLHEWKADLAMLSGTHCTLCGTPLPAPSSVTPTYILVKTTASDNYLGFGSWVAEIDRTVKIVACYPEHAEWQLIRYASGLQSLSFAYYPTLEAARSAAEELELQARPIPPPTPRTTA